MGAWIGERAGGPDDPLFPTITGRRLKAYMGHADIATTMIYVHHVPQVDAAEKLSAALREASTGPPVPSVRPAA